MKYARRDSLFLFSSRFFLAPREIRDRAENSSARFEFREIKIRERIVFPSGNRSYRRIALHFFPREKEDGPTRA